MKRFLLLLPLIQCYLLKAQNVEFSIKDLISFTDLSINKFDNYISKKGYRPCPDLSANAFSKLSKEHKIEKLLERYDRSDTSAVCYTTYSEFEFTALRKELEKAGFAYEEIDGQQKGFPSLYQQKDIAIRPAVKQDSGKLAYAFTIERKRLPRMTDIRYAEDLLLLNSHENLVAVFGVQNVKKDVFYFDKEELTKCSVLFPNTSRQAIFIWKDQSNRKDVDFVLIGGHVRSQSQRNYDKQIGMNSWKSRQGLHLGMFITELEELNGESFLFHGWESEQPGVISPINSGSINFKKLGVQLNCFNCREDEFYTKNGPLISSDNFTRENSRVYVSTLILLP